jgi:hypothetical protein
MRAAKRGPPAKTDASGADQHDASRSAETSDQQHHEHVDDRGREFQRRYHIGDKDPNRESGRGHRQERGSSSQP